MTPDFSYLGSAGDAHIDFHLSEDGMTLTADFYPAQEGRLHLVSAQVEAFLAEKGIVHGVLLKELQRAVYECNTSRQVLQGVVIARGTPPKKEVPSYWRLEPGLFQERGVTPDGKIDYREWSPYVVVHAHQLLARAVAPKPGELGYNVRGEAIPFGKKDVVRLLPGRNTVVHHGEAYAKIAGRLVQDRSYFHVDDSLEVDQVGYATGHIRFPGHVLVKSGVLDGFRVWVGQDLKVMTTLDATDVYVHGNLEVKGGILGKHRGLVRVGGNLNADFAENVKIDVLGDAFVRKTILHSEVLVKGEFSMGEGGRILASVVMSRGDCTIAEVGNPSTGARVAVGIDFVQKRKADALKVAITDLENQRLALLTLPIQDDVVRQRISEAEEKLAHLVSQYNDLNKSMVNSAAVLRVPGRVHASSVIEMGHVSMEVRDTLQHKQFRLSEDGHSILVQNLDPPKR